MKKLFNWFRMYKPQEVPNPKTSREDLERKLATTEDDEWDNYPT